MGKRSCKKRGIDIIDKIIECDLQRKRKKESERERMQIIDNRRKREKKRRVETLKGEEIEKKGRLKRGVAV